MNKKEVPAGDLSPTGGCRIIIFSPKAFSEASFYRHTSMWCGACSSACFNWRCLIFAEAGMRNRTVRYVSSICVLHLVWSGFYRAGLNFRGLRLCSRRATRACHKLSTPRLRETRPDFKARTPPSPTEGVVVQGMGFEPTYLLGRAPELLSYELPPPPA